LPAGREFSVMLTHAASGDKRFRKLVVRRFALADRN
jgi:hypothetical protein